LHRERKKWDIYGFFATDWGFDSWYCAPSAAALLLAQVETGQPVEPLQRRAGIGFLPATDRYLKDLADPYSSKY
jgi:hypothetical protein